MAASRGSRKNGVAPFVLDGAVDRFAFQTYVARVLVPELRSDRVVIVDNLPPPFALPLHSASPSRIPGGLRPRGTARGGSDRGGWCEASPACRAFCRGFKPIETAFAKLDALLRKAAERIVAALRAAIHRPVDLITPGERADIFAAAR